MRLLKLTANSQYNYRSINTQTNTRIQTGTNVKIQQEHLVIIILVTVGRKVKWPLDLAFSEIKTKLHETTDKQTDKQTNIENILSLTNINVYESSRDDLAAVVVFLSSSIKHVKTLVTVFVAVKLIENPFYQCFSISRKQIVGYANAWLVELIVSWFRPSFPGLLMALAAPNCFKAQRVRACRSRASKNRSIVRLFAN